MFCNSHKFNVGISHLFYIGSQLMSQLSVIIESRIVFILCFMFLPGTRMYFVDCHRISVFIKLRTFFHPCGIFPFVAGNICDPGCSSRTKFCFITIRVCLINLLTMISYDKKLIQITDSCFRYKNFIDTYRTCFFHWIGLCIPVIKIAHNRNISGIRCPYSKINTFLTFLCGRMCSQFFVDVVMCSLTKQVLIKFRKLQLFSHPRVLPFVLKCTFICIYFCNL